MWAVLSMTHHSLPWRCWQCVPPLYLEECTIARHGAYVLWRQKAQKATWPYWFNTNNAYTFNTSCIWGIYNVFIYISYIYIYTYNWVFYLLYLFNFMVLLILWLLKFKYFLKRMVANSTWSKFFNNLTKLLFCKLTRWVDSKLGQVVPTRRVSSRHVQSEATRTNLEWTQKHTHQYLPIIFIRVG